MKSQNLGSLAAALLLIGTVALNMGGCNFSIVPESKLAGTWHFKTDDGAVQDIFLTFNTAGKLDRVRYQVGDVAALTDENPRGTASVDGDTATISTTFGLGELRFSGQFNADETAIIGNTTLRFALFTFSLTIDNGGATLTRQ